MTFQPCRPVTIKFFLMSISFDTCFVYDQIFEKTKLPFLELIFILRLWCIEIPRCATVTGDDGTIPVKRFFTIPFERAATIIIFINID